MLGEASGGYIPLHTHIFVSFRKLLETEILKMETDLNDITLASEDSTSMNNIQPVCKFNQIGFCKFGSSCHKMHVNTLCPNQNCSKKKCSDRHPRICKYCSLNGSCKFGSKCAFEHRKGENVNKIEEA